MSESESSAATVGEDAGKTRWARRMGSLPAGPMSKLVTMRMVILFNLLRRSALLTQRKDFGLSEIEWRIMTLMNRGEHPEPLSLNDIAQMLVQDRGQLSRAVKGMVERGILTRNRKPGGPEIEIGLADRGRELHALMVERALERDRFLLEDIDPADIEVMRRVVDKMILKAEMLMEDAL